MASTGVFNSIRGFNRAWTSVTSIAVQKNRVRTVIGYRFECACGTVKKFLDTYFHDSHAAAMAALNNHHCVKE